MKLRDFVANSLPRVRGRKKKGQPPTSATAAAVVVNGTAASITAALAAAAAATSSTTPAGTTHPSADILDSTTTSTTTTTSQRLGPGRQGGHHTGHWFQFGESRFGFLERLVGKESPVKRLFGEAKARQKALQPTQREEEERIYYEVKDHRAKTGSANEEEEEADAEEGGILRPYGSVEVTSVFPDSPCLCPCSAPVSPTCSSCPLHLRGRCGGVGGGRGGRGGRQVDSDRASVYSGGQGGCADSVTSYDSTPGSQRAVRNRSRIRTNPWLPSPRPSPYCARSLSSPCASSRSPSPSSSPSPAPPSSSSNASPLTSHSGDVAAARESHFHRHRRHRRHHSEVNAADFTRHFLFDAHLTDTEQYFPHPDHGGGVGRRVASLDEGDKQRTGPWRKHRTLNTKRKSSERDSRADSHHHHHHQLGGCSFESSSPSPKLKAKSRSRTKSSLSSSSKGVVANRDSKFWDSDSSRSPPRALKPFGSRPHKSSSPRFGSCKDSESVWDSDSSSRPHGLPRNEPSCLGLNSRSFLFETLSGDLGSASGSGSGSGLGSAAAVDEALSRPVPPCEDICVLTSNIEQLAQNISFEYEAGLDTRHDSAPNDAVERDDRCASLRELFNIDSEDRVSHMQQQREEESPHQLGLDLDYSSFAEPLQSGQPSKEERSQLDLTLTENSPVGLTTYQDENMLTKDVGVQTDFIDDDEEENSGSDWLASTESGSDWLASNGSGSDWLASGGSGCDWLAGEGSGCGTEEEGVVGVEGEASISWEEEEGGEGEGGKLWIVPDIMQDSTDTGYSSLSRDGRVVTDDNNNNCNSSSSSNSSHNNNNNNNNARNTDDSSDSANASDEKTASDSRRKPTHESTGDRGKTDRVISGTGAIPKTSSGKTAPVETTVVYENFDDDTREHSHPQRACEPLAFRGVIHNGNGFHKTGFEEEKNVLGSSGYAQRHSQYCSCDAGFSTENDDGSAWEGQARAQPRRGYRERDCVIPYPYDVTRFSDVTVTGEEWPGSVSPRYVDNVVASRPDWTRERKSRSRPTPYAGSPLRCCRGDTCPDDFSFSRSRFQTGDDVANGDDAHVHPYSSYYSISSHNNSSSSSSSLRRKADLELASSRSPPVPSLPAGPPPLPSATSAAAAAAEEEDVDLAPSEELPSTGRSLGEVTASLEEKVLLLRQGKHVVHRKIREAREEEMLRRQQKLRFQRLLDIHRKQILLETLQDLRQRLQSQSARLQASYSAVLDIQKRYA